MPKLVPTFSICFLWRPVLPGAECPQSLQGFSGVFPFCLWDPRRSVRQLRPSFQGPRCSYQSYRQLCLWVWWSQGQHPRGWDCSCILGQCLPEGWVAESNYTKEEKMNKGLSERRYLSGAQCQEGQCGVERAQSNVISDV